jgi:hypothetical protein
LKIAVYKRRRVVYLHVIGNSKTRTNPMAKKPAATGPDLSTSGLLALTESHLELLTSKQLADVHNALGVGKPVARFADKEAALKRTVPALAAFRKLHAPAAKPAVPDALPPTERNVETVAALKALAGSAVASPTKRAPGSFSAAPAPKSAFRAFAAAVERVAAAVERVAVSEVNGTAAKALPPPLTTKKPTIASRVRGLVTAGKTNDEIWLIVKAEFGMPDDKRWFVGWYRADMKRRAARSSPIPPVQPGGEF